MEEKFLKSRCFIYVLTFLDQKEWISLQALSKSFYSLLESHTEHLKVQLKESSKYLYCASVSKSKFNKNGKVYRIKVPCNIKNGLLDDAIEMPFKLLESERFWVIDTKTYFCQIKKRYIKRTFMFKPFFGKPLEQSQL